MKIGILGSGFMGQTHARAYAKLPGVEIVAVSSQGMDKAEKLAAEVGGRAVTDDRAIIEDPAGSVFVKCTGPKPLLDKTTPDFKKMIAGAHR